MEHVQCRYKHLTKGSFMKRLELHYSDSKAPGMCFMVVIRETQVKEARRWLRVNKYALRAFKPLLGGK